MGCAYNILDVIKCMHYSKNSELKIALLLVNIIVYTECQQSQNSAVGLSFLCYYCCYSKTCPKRPLKKKGQIGFQDNAGRKYCRIGLHSAAISHEDLCFVYF